MKKISGTLTALVTPFVNGEVDYKSLEALVKYQLNAGIEGFIVNGTTGESPTLSQQEREKIFSEVKKMVGNSLPVVIGTGTNSTEESARQTKRAAELGADAALVVVPYYNKPPQRGLEEHFVTIAKSSSIQNILYNVPGRTITSLEASTVKKIADRCSNVRAIKEASGNIDTAKKLAAELGPEFTLLSGDDESYVEFLLAGGTGVISVASHILPNEFVNFKRLVDAKNVEQARKEMERISPLVKLLFAEANPIPVKMALYKMGIIASPECRLPLVTHAEGLTEILVKEMRRVGVLNV
jgi:4-hydroxy-tetrahydrodipicolinate synthase